MVGVLEQHVHIEIERGGSRHSVSVKRKDVRPTVASGGSCLEAAAMEVSIGWG